ncbi:hypothetical protein BV898_01112 [Hypsibius exemplaris]|uniref:Uncharacterized protein n=1 Tax=Hypsibius exemplaris TaxID=2072580 RepID=A0A1W0XD74_HYPEX|nr:hypothetical protein BV898_01112 [Hypsibius exemplaris]
MACTSQPTRCFGEQSAQSDIQYFTTKSKQPSMPTAVRTESLTPLHSVQLEASKEPNGVIASYQFVGRESETVIAVWRSVIIATIRKWNFDMHGIDVKLLG